MRAYKLQQDIQLPLPTALWVLGAHLYALLIPLLLIVALTHHWTGVVSRTDYPAALFVAAGLMMAGSAFEIAQNAIDKWYLTPDCASAEGTGFCDLLFYWLIVASQAAVAIACMGSSAWVLLLAVASTALFPFLYVRQIAQFAPLGVTGLLAVVTAWLRFDDPVIFLQLLLSPLTLMLFGCLLRTGNQVLHGFTTAAASSGVVLLAWGIHGGVSDAPQTWLAVGAVAAATGLLAVLVRPLLLRLPATPRRV